MGLLLWHDLGRLDFEEAWLVQKRVQAALIGRSIPGDGVLLFVEHPHVYTVGARGQRASATGGPVEPGPIHDETGAVVPVIPVNRGGDITYHGPGQLVGYALVRLAAVPTVGGDVVKWLRLLERVLVDTCRLLGLQATVLAPHTGVWTAPPNRELSADEPYQGLEKIASIGVSMRNGVTMHGFALNLDPARAMFDRIVPCGLNGVRMARLADHLDPMPARAEVRRILTRCLSERLEFHVEPASKRGLWPSPADRRGE